MSTLFFLLEFFATSSVLFYVFQINFRTSIKSHIPFCLLALMSIVYYVYCDIHHLNGIPQTFFVLIICLFLFKSKIIPLITNISLIVLFTSLIPGIISYLYYILNNTEYLPHSLFTITASLISYLLFILFPIFFKNKTQSLCQLLEELTNKYYLLILIITVFDFFIFQMSALLINPTETINSVGRLLLLLCIWGIIILSIVVLFMYFCIKKYNNFLIDMNRMNNQLLKQEEKHYIEIRKKNEDLRAFRHDYNHHISALHKLAKQEDFISLKDYIFKMSDIKDSVTYIQTNNIVADSIINYFYEKYSHKVLFQVDGKFPAENFFVNNTDICTLISNTMKNAIEAAIQTSNPAVSISLFANYEYATIFVENTSKEYSLSELNNLKTTKSDTLNHGFGLKNILKVVEQYSGSLDIDYLDNHFSTKIYLHNINQR